jgi:glyceraldehyde-3-phosphate dehydrogenase/erythrose-4-phosphate dehydrogenase
VQPLPVAHGQRAPRRRTPPTTTNNKVETHARRARCRCRQRPQVEKKTFAEEVNNAFKEAANGPMKGVLAVSDEPLVSVDFRCVCVCV